MKNYKSFKELELDLERSNLERKVALEELKVTKTDFDDQVKSLNSVSTILKYAGKYGFLFLIKKFFK